LGGKGKNRKEVSSLRLGREGGSGSQKKVKCCNVTGTFSLRKVFPKEGPGIVTRRRGGTEQCGRISREVGGFERKAWQGSRNRVDWLRRKGGLRGKSH